MTGSGTGRFPAMRVALVWLPLCAMQLVVALPKVRARIFPDQDDVLRLVQVRDLLAGQNWFDLHQYRIDWPGGVLMHWSRIVDAPLALSIAALRPLLGPASAEQATLVVIPLLTLAAIVAAAGKAASYRLDKAAVALACLCLALSPLLLLQVQPMRIDHHGWQIFTVMLALVGVAQGTRASGPVLAGAALALGLSISLEILPMAAAFGLVFAFRWLADGKTRRPFVLFMTSLAIGLVVLFAATRGLADLAEHCDTISPAHLLMFALLALGSAGVATLRSRSPIVLAGALLVVGSAGLGLYLLLAPQCIAGPFGNLDPLVREFWYEHIAEGRPAWETLPGLWIPVALQGLVALAALLRLWLTTTGEERRWWFEYLIVLSVAFAAGLLTWRSMGFVGALCAIPLGWLTVRLFEALRKAPSAPGKLAVAVMLLLCLVPSVPFTLAAALSNKAADGRDGELVSGSASDCERIGSAAKLDGLAPGVVFAPFDIGPTLLLASKHRVVATGHHRARAALHDAISAFLGTPEHARAAIEKHRADYVLVCTDLSEMKLYRERAPNGFAARLARGQAPDWLEPVRLDLPPSLKVWRVVRRGQRADRPARPLRPV